MTLSAVQPMYELIGGNPSPYSRKLRAVMRYRRIPHIWRLTRPKMSSEIDAIKPKLIPILRFPDGTYRIDSTPLAHELEARHSERSIIPPDAADAFVCHLIEDYADEWGTKWMFHHRWKEDVTAAWAANWIAQDSLPTPQDAHGQAFAKFFHDRQRSRMALVGSTPATAALIENSYIKVLHILGAQLGGEHYLFGTRPSLADFALYGQLAQLSTDPWPLTILRKEAPILEGWVIALDDASGVEGEWNPETPATAETRKALLARIGAEYLPFLSANAAALQAGQKEVRVSIEGQIYTQDAFAYQGKCYVEILRRWQALPQTARAQLEPLLAETGCLPWLTVTS
ncbi:MAG: glutathione S-transferase C-terminal domain-containing protein [Pseudomonadota bacterium]